MSTKGKHNLQNQEIMKKEQIIHALYTQKVIGNIDLMELLEKAGYKDYSISAIIDRITDAILAIPLDVPTDQEIKDEIFANNPVLDGDPEWIYGFRQGQFSGAKMMRNEIIKRNRVI